jgi:primosomal protein N' (replication factor Y)
MKVDIAIPRTKTNVFTYRSSDALDPGDLVQVPLRNQKKYGIVIKPKSTRTIPITKDIIEIVEKKFIPASMLALYKWIAEYYVSTLGEVLRLALPQKILKKAVEAKEKTAASSLARTPIPTYQQSNAIRHITQAMKKGSFASFLLYGITGSGKTEVYLRCAEEIIKHDGRVLLLVPEISMTALLYVLFKERFKDEVITIHSSLSPTQRRNAWYAIKNGDYRIVIGPRSSIFIPIPNLRLIVVDEEHDPSYKEHERLPRYNARDVAVMRAKLENSIIVLGSATPQIESYYNAQTGKYRLLTLEKRIDDKSLPRIEIVDLKKETHRYISPQLEHEIEERLKKQEQVILFLNRRGFAPHLLCPACGFVARCPYCNLPLVFHKGEKKGKANLACHICSYKTQLITICPQCARGTLLYRGAGTQRIEEMVRRLVEKYDSAQQTTHDRAVLRLDRDAARKRGHMEKVLTEFARGDSPVLLGTQLVTKGFDFPNVTLVGVVSADVVLNLPDFRSGERTFQTLTQVAGRSGRGTQQGEVLIQTHYPQAYATLFSQLQNYPQFYSQEIQLRKEMSFPPFTRLILLRIKSTDEQNVWNESTRIHSLVSRIRGCEIYGPNRSFYYKVRKNYRVFILLKVSKKFNNAQLAFLRNHRTKNCSLEIDVDPLEVF